MEGEPSPSRHIGPAGVDHINLFQPNQTSAEPRTPPLGRQHYSIHAYVRAHMHAAAGGAPGKEGYATRVSPAG